MSTRSDPLNVDRENPGSVENKNDTPMLNDYLAAPPTITEKLSISSQSNSANNLVEDKANESKEFVAKWQASWEKKS
ncbi:hypothetical protein GLAREA_04945 [Glarea lozoyensis ATCC 20868]|uniref:Uncharacterized protein n=2 Tax=Glarea lozoyensis TaxID=101852 RepID=S3CSU6_GLAL2|nr:uncharacterized protein GLAREA_04945 [Glarea lozoyensis ATCC 20868]EHL02073.1 hypothetical protein M7I_2028 [Glarea lozoyensis 74030]EPE28154.1 hypothetical protein GLAREA_04945 [Glarea lozoyensis ATCC 20868]